MGIVAESSDPSNSNLVLDRNKFQKRQHRWHLWDEAEEKGFRTKSQWRTCGRGTRGTSLNYIEYKGRKVKLYHESETSILKSKTKAQDYLLHRFVVRSDIFGWQPLNSDKWPQCSDYRWDLKPLIKRGWHHARCHKGISFDDKLAQGFSIRAAASTEDEPSKTHFVVIDSDYHDPGDAALKHHLEDIEKIQNNLPKFLNEYGGGNWFFQYRRPFPTGIQIWICLNWKVNTRSLHDDLRNFLAQLGVTQIEILPSENQQISAPACYPKSLFTDRELPLINGWVDVVSLAEHIREQKPAGDVLPRYRALLELDLDSACVFRPAVGKEGSPQATPQLTLRPTALRLHDPKEGKRYWTDLKRMAVEGITSSDTLCQHLQPLAQALYFRDFAHEDDRLNRTAAELFDWVCSKHNGHVSRILRRKEHEVRAQCFRVVKQIEKKTCQLVRDYYSSILANDLIYPHRVELIHWLMRQSVPESKYDLSFGFYCKCRISQDPDPTARSIDNTPLPESITPRIEKAAEELRKGKVRERFIRFAIRFVNELAAGEAGERNIHWQHLNKMLDIPDVKGRDKQDRWKKLLQKHGIIKGDWHKFIRRGSCSSRYRLVDEIWEEICSERRVVEKSA